MEEGMWAIGKETLWMHSVFTHGKMAECMKAFTKRIKSMDMAFTHGLTRRSTQAGGVTANSMESECLFLKREGRNLGYGRMARNCVGSLLKKPS